MIQGGQSYGIDYISIKIYHRPQRQTGQQMKNIDARLILTAEGAKNKTKWLEQLKYFTNKATF